MKKFFRSYLTNLENALNNLDYEVIRKICEILIQAQKDGKRVFLIGNGGSSSTPSHAAGDWAKTLNLKSICLTDNSTAVTAFANDTSYSNIFSGQLKIFLEPGDVVIGYSGSGNSQNVINAINYANEKGNLTIGITGNYKKGNGGKLAKITEISLIVNTTSMERIEDIHLIITHIIKEYIKKHFE